MSDPEPLEWTAELLAIAKGDPYRSSETLPEVCRSGGRLAVGVPRSYSHATEIRPVAEGIQGDSAQADLFASSVEICRECKA